MKKEKEVKQKREFTFGIPLILVLVVAPLLVFMTVYKTDIGDNNWISGYAFYDFFLFFKERLLRCTGIVFALMMLFSVRKYRGNLTCKKESLCLVPVAVFGVMSLLSAIASKHPQDAFFGGYEQFESVFVLLCYVFCFAFAYIYVTDEKWVNLLLYFLLFGSLIVSLLGAFQTFGMDYMKSEWFSPVYKMFMDDLPENFKIRLVFGDGVAYSTLFNPNYIGSYVALVLPVTVLVGIWPRGRVSLVWLVRFKGILLPGIWPRGRGLSVVAAVSAVCQVIMLFGAQSMTGLIGVAGAALVALVFLFSDIRKNRWILGGAAALVVVGALGVALVKPDLISRFTQTALEEYNDTISSIETEKGNFTINLSNGNQIQVNTQEGGSIYQYSIADGDGNALPTGGEPVKSGTFIDREGYENVLLYQVRRKVQKDGEEKLYEAIRIVSKETCFWDLTKRDGEIYCINAWDKFDKFREIEKWGFEGHYSLATNRGYMWSRTIPLLKYHLFLGSGADNFVYSFPNDDYVGKMNCGIGGQTVTKPHNMYMQIWVQDGMLACLALVVLFVMFLVRTVRHCFVKGRLSYLQKVQIALLAGCSGYMVAGLANDATICVTPIFWVLLGLGFAVDICSKREKEEG